jgi:hypothetical protein
MEGEPIHKREYHVFLSHASIDKKAIVNELYGWLTKIANIPVWYDQAILAGGNSLPESIGKAIPNCRSMVLVLSPASVKSSWVQKECSLAEQHRMHYRDFKIIPVLIDDCELPSFLQDSLYIDAKDNQLTTSFYHKLLQALYPFDPSVEFKNTSDIFVSRTWHNSEAKFADRICQEFIQSSFRLVGDAKDHPSYKDSKKRVESIISSCGGLLAILPYREDKPDSHYTSPYCLDEIATASKYNLPSIVIAEPGVTLPDSFKKSLAYFQHAEDRSEVDGDSAFIDAVECMRERWKKPNNEHYVFFATDFDNPERNQIVRLLIQQITGISCVIGEDVQYSDRSIQEAIASLIRYASLVIADVSQDRINTLIEAGIARGANVDYRMIACATSEFPRKRPPFMFRDKQIDYYLSDAELLGRIHRLTYPFRRRVLNYEIKV